MNAPLRLSSLGEKTLRAEGEEKSPPRERKPPQPPSVEGGVVRGGGGRVTLRTQINSIFEMLAPRDKLAFIFERIFLSKIRPAHGDLPLERSESRTSLRIRTNERRVSLCTNFVERAGDFVRAGVIFRFARRAERILPPQGGVRAGGLEVCLALRTN